MIRVSRLLSQYGLSPDPWWYTDESRERGQVVHSIAQSLLLKQSISVAPSFDGYAKALTKAFELLGIVPVAVERRLQFAPLLTGRPDVVGYLPKSIGEIPAGPCVVDIKSGEPLASHGIQLALYEKLADMTPDLRDALPIKMRGLPWQRIGLYVLKNGRHKPPQRYDDMHDRIAADCLLSLTLWRISKGLIVMPSTTVELDDPVDDPEGAM